MKKNRRPFWLSRKSRRSSNRSTSKGGSRLRFETLEPRVVLSATLQEAGISAAGIAAINNSEYSSTILNDSTLQNTLDAIAATRTAPGNATVLTTVGDLSQITAGTVSNPNIYLIQGNLTLPNGFNIEVPSNVHIYVDGSIYKAGSHTRTPGQPSENDTDLIFSVNNKQNVQLIGVNNALLHSRNTLDDQQGHATAVYVTGSTTSNILVEGFEIANVWEGLVARGDPHDVTFMNNYVRNTLKRGIWHLTSTDSVAAHNFLENLGADGMDWDAFVDSSMGYENVVIGAGRWLGFVEEAAHDSYFVRNLGLMVDMGNPNADLYYQLGWADHGTTWTGGQFTRDNYFIDNVVFRPTSGFNEGGDYYANQPPKGMTYFWANRGHGAGQTSDLVNNFINAEWLDYVPTAGGKDNAINGVQLLADLNNQYNSTSTTTTIVDTGYTSADGFVSGLLAWQQGFVGQGGTTVDPSGSGKVTTAGGAWLRNAYSSGILATAGQPSFNAGDQLDLVVDYQLQLSGSGNVSGGNFGIRDDISNFGNLTPQQGFQVNYNSGGASGGSVQFISGSNTTNLDGFDLGLDPLGASGPVDLLSDPMRITYQIVADGLDNFSVFNFSVLNLATSVETALTASNTFTFLGEAFYTQGLAQNGDLGFVGMSDGVTLNLTTASSNQPPTGSVTTSGVPTEDQTLTASNNLSDSDGLGPISYQWQRNGGNISGATSSSYTLGDADVGAAITVVASYTDGGGTYESVASAGVGPVANVNDAPTGTVTISGIATEDQTLTASNGLADADGLGAISYQWQRNGGNIAGATSSSYTLGDADVGATITVVASYTDGQGANESVSSAGVGPVANVNDAPTGTVTISGTTTEGQSLTASNTLVDNDGLGAFGYQWLRDGVAVSGATSGSYTLGSADVGARMSVSISYTDAQGANEGPLSSAETAIVEAATASGPNLASGILGNVGTAAWTTVNLPQSYTSMVVVATPVHVSGLAPVVTRISNVTSNSFDVKVQRTDGSSANLSGIQVQYVVAEEGVYSQAADGITMEAVKFTSTVTDQNNSWIGQQRSYQGAYSSPVVLGQVMSTNDADWSTFWSYGSSRTNPANETNLNVGKHVGEDSDTTRANETIGYLVIESGSGTVSGLNYSAGVGSDIVRGVGNGGTHIYNASGLGAVTSAVASVAGMDGGDGGWAMLNGASALSGATLSVIVDEDQLGNSERSHTTEQVAYIAFEQDQPPIAVDDSVTATQDVVLVVSVLANDMDPNGDPLQIDSFTPGSSGTVSDNGDGTLTYTPNAGFTGADSFSYTISDGNGGTSTATVNVNVTAPSTWTDLAFEDFENGFGSYTDGGGDAYLHTRGTHAHQGNNAVGLQDNSGTSSSITLTDGLDLDSPGYTNLRVEFWFKAVSFENNEDFFLEYHDGTSWQVIETWTRNVDFQNNEFNFASVEISENDYAFSANSKIRLRSDASGNADDVYIDEIRISAS